MSILNVKDYGVTGDGATLETKAIQKVITEAKDGDTLVFPKGYYVTGTLLYLRTCNGQVLLVKYIHDWSCHLGIFITLLIAV